MKKIPKSQNWKPGWQKEATESRIWRFPGSSLVWLQNTWQLRELEAMCREKHQHFCFLKNQHIEWWITFYLLFEGCSRHPKSKIKWKPNISDRLDTLTTISKLWLIFIHLWGNWFFFKCFLFSSSCCFRLCDKQPQFSFSFQMQLMRLSLKNSLLD